MDAAGHRPGDRPARREPAQQVRWNPSPVRPERSRAPPGGAAARGGPCWPGQPGWRSPGNWSPLQVLILLTAMRLPTGGVRKVPLPVHRGIGPCGQRPSLPRRLTMRAPVGGLAGWLRRSAQAVRRLHRSHGTDHGPPLRGKAMSRPGWCAAWPFGLGPAWRKPGATEKPAIRGPGICTHSRPDMRAPMRVPASGDCRAAVRPVGAPAVIVQSHSSRATACPGAASARGGSRARPAGKPGAPRAAAGPDAVRTIAGSCVRRGPPFVCRHRRAEAAARGVCRIVASEAAELFLRRPVKVPEDAVDPGISGAASGWPDLLRATGCRPSPPRSGNRIGQLGPSGVSWRGPDAFRGRSPGQLRADAVEELAILPAALQLEGRRSAIGRKCFGIRLLQPSLGTRFQLRVPSRPHLAFSNSIGWTQGAAPGRMPRAPCPRPAPSGLFAAGLERR